MMERLSGRHAIVTGGASGIGRACVERLLSDGATVTAFDVAFPLAGRKSQGSRRERHVVCDVSDETAVREAVADDLDCYDGIDILLNCAGIIEKSVAVETSLSSWNHVLAVNLTGAFLMSREVARAMARVGRGSIVSIASIDAHTGDAGELSYTASKAGMLGLTRGLAIELGPVGVRVNSVSPGLVITPMNLSDSTADASAREVLAGRFDRVPLRRAILAEEVAATCVFLASDEASGITGQDIVVDGGLLADAYLVKALKDPSIKRKYECRRS